MLLSSEIQSESQRLGQCVWSQYENVRRMKGIGKPLKASSGALYPIKIVSAFEIGTCEMSVSTCDCFDIWTAWKPCPCPFPYWASHSHADLQSEILRHPKSHFTCVQLGAEWLVQVVWFLQFLIGQHVVSHVINSHIHLRHVEMLDLTTGFYSLQALQMCKLKKIGRFLIKNEFFANELLF